MRWIAAAAVERWDVTGRALPGTEVPGNLVTGGGIGRVLALLTGAGGTALTATSGRIGVGDGTRTATATDTDLAAAAGSSHRWFQTFDAGYPTVTGTSVQLRATFGPDDGTFAWREWGTDVSAPTVASGSTVGALLLQHRTGLDLGTKVPGQTWRLTVTITLAST